MTPTAPPPEKPTAPPSFPEPKPSTPVETGRAETLARLADALGEKVEHECAVIFNRIADGIENLLSVELGFGNVREYFGPDGSFRLSAEAKEVLCRFMEMHKPSDGLWETDKTPALISFVVTNQVAEKIADADIRPIRPAAKPVPPRLSDEEIGRRLSEALKEAFKDLPGVQLVLHPRVDITA